MLRIKNFHQIKAINHNKSIVNSPYLLAMGNRKKLRIKLKKDK